MSSVAADNNEIILKQVSRYQRRLLCLVLFRALVWSGTILIAGMGLSRFKIPAMPALTIFISSSLAVYYLWHHYPQSEQVVRILDQRLSLKEGLVTAFQFRESEKHFVPLLINQLRPRLIGARPHQIFPFKIPKVLLAWPFLLALMIVPAETGPLRFFNFHQNLEERGALKTDASVPVQEGIVNSERSSITSNTSLGLTKKKETVISSQSENTVGEGLKPSPTPIDRGLDSHVRVNDGEFGAFSGETPMPLQGIKEHKDINPAQAGIQVGEGFKPSPTTPAEVWIPTYVGMTDAVHSAVVQILTRQDLPEDYKEYVKSYFDAIQEGGEIHGEQRRD